MTATLLRSTPATPANPFAHHAALVGHSHFLRTGRHTFEETKQNLVAWARTCHVRAFGLGSTWEPVSARNYWACETTRRDEYYAGRIPPESIMDRDAIAAFVADMNRLSNGETLFYLDNETPKNRYGHLWYVGFDYQVPCWHDYGQDKRTAFWDGEHTPDLNALTGLPHRRRGYMEVVAKQRAAGALAIWAHPTSWWWQDKNFTTNIAADMVPQLLADGYLDGMVVQGYDAFHRAYQALWFHLLDRGYKIPGYSEMDVSGDISLDSLKHVLVNQIPTSPNSQIPKSLNQLIAPLRASRHFMTSGPFLDITVDGNPSGSTLVASPGACHNVAITAFPAPGESCLSRVQLIGNGGVVLAEVENFSGGILEIGIEVPQCGIYLLARAIGEHDTPDMPQQKIKHCALTNPVYLRTPDTPNPKPLATRLTLLPPQAAHHDGAKFRVLTAAGEPLESGTLSNSEITLEVPASARFEITCTNGQIRDIPLSMANPAVREQMDYLADGHFLKDHPHCTAGEVPVEAFRVDAVREAMQNLRFAL